MLTGQQATQPSLRSQIGQRAVHRNIKKETEAARADQAEMIAEVEAEIDNEFSDLERESKRDIENDKMPGNIRDRNDF